MGEQMEEKKQGTVEGELEVPPSSGVDTEYLTRDLESALERETLELVQRIARERGISPRRAVAFTIAALRGLP
jgi:hypothetical protein